MKVNYNIIMFYYEFLNHNFEKNKDKYLDIFDINQDKLKNNSSKIGFKNKKINHEIKDWLGKRLNDLLIHNYESGQDIKQIFIPKIAFQYCFYNFNNSFNPIGIDINETKKLISSDSMTTYMPSNLRSYHTSQLDNRLNNFFKEIKSNKTSIIYTKFSENELVDILNLNFNLHEIKDEINNPNLENLKEFISKINLQRGINTNINPDYENQIKFIYDKFKLKDYLFIENNQVKSIDDFLHKAKNFGFKINDEAKDFILSANGEAFLNYFGKPTYGLIFYISDHFDKIKKELIQRQ